MVENGRGFLWIGALFLVVLFFWVMVGKNEVKPAGAEVKKGGAAFHKLCADALAMGKNFEKALAEYQLATDIDPNYSQAYLAMGHIYKELGKIPDAQRSFCLACLSFGRCQRLRAFLGREPQPDLRQGNSPKDLLDMVLLFSVARADAVTWTDPYRSLGLLLTQYDQNGNLISKEKKMMLFMADQGEDCPKVLPEDFLKNGGISDETYRRFKEGIGLLDFCENHELLYKIIPSVGLSIESTLAFEDEQYQRAADCLREAIKIEEREGAKKEFQEWLAKLEQLINAKKEEKGK